MILEKHDTEYEINFISALASYMESLEHTAKIESIPKIAVFDLDNTLINGDIGEAVFAQLKLNGYDLPLTWSRYRELCETDIYTAYTSIISSMAGVPVSAVKNATESLIKSPDDFLELEGEAIRIPTIEPIMNIIIDYLRTSGFSVFIISSSNDISVKIIAKNWFGIPSQKAFGISVSVNRGKLATFLGNPIPIGEGKVELYHKYIASTPPLITASDSLHDLPILRSTHPRGISLWLGDDQSFLKTVRGNNLMKNLFSVPRKERLKYQQY